MIDLYERLAKAVEMIEKYSEHVSSYYELLRRLNLLESKFSDQAHKLERLEKQHYTMLKQYGSFRVSLNAFIDGLDRAKLPLDKVSVGYTMKEIDDMSAKDYKEKILVPLGIA